MCGTMSRLQAQLQDRVRACMTLLQDGLLEIVDAEVAQATNEARQLRRSKNLAFGARRFRA